MSLSIDARNFLISHIKSESDSDVFASKYVFFADFVQLKSSKLQDKCIELLKNTSMKDKYIKYKKEISFIKFKSLEKKQEIAQKMTNLKEIRTLMLMNAIEHFFENHEIYEMPHKYRQKLLNSQLIKRVNNHLKI